MPHRKSSPNTTLIVGIVACFVTVVTACTVAFIFTPEGDAVATFLTMVLGFATSTVAALVTLTKVQAVDQKVDYLANGGMDSKVRAGVAEVLKDEFVDPDAKSLIEADRAHRAAGPGASTSG
jgi:hypothetical protein